ncbi:MAG: exosortase/archaeosortase family protein [Opitutales bacterium]
MLLRKSQILTIAAGLGVTLLAFMPLLQWLVDYTSSNTQLLHAFIILAFAGAMLIYERNERIQFAPGYNKQVFWGFLISYGFISIAFFAKLSLLYLPALVGAIYGWCHYLFGVRYNRVVTALLVAFSLFLGLLILFPTMDWPLRMLAGQISHIIFSQLGGETHLFLMKENVAQAEPLLIVTMGGRPFEVAPECNGFGMLSASTLLSVLLSVYYRLGIGRSTLLVLISLLSSFAMNLIRILIIVYLAPWVGDHYYTMHEIIGITAFWMALIGIWMIGKRFDEQTASPSEST